LAKVWIWNKNPKFNVTYIQTLVRRRPKESGGNHFDFPAHASIPMIPAQGFSVTFFCE
jgi:hypothetical protein